MSVFFKMNNEGRVILQSYAITNGKYIIPCPTEDYANKLLMNRRYITYTIVQSDEPSEKLLETLKGVRFDTYEDAENFINGGGWQESVLSRVEDIELVIAELIGG